MRIVIDIDPSHLSGDVASATPLTASIDNVAGVAVSLESASVPEASGELLARAAALNAQNAGPAPRLAAPTAIRNALVTLADSPTSPSALGAEARPSPTGGREGMHDGGITNAGPAPQ